VEGIKEKEPVAAKVEVEAVAARANRAVAVKAKARDVREPDSPEAVKLGVLAAVEKIRLINRMTDRNNSSWRR
jgi:hypothetical protein